MDIDVFEEVSVGMDDEKIWEIMDKLREIKNDIFLKSITEETKELFR
ncbi:MAG: TIGR04255 family protein [Rhabdochlamydiaceae bacterium]